MTVLNPAVSDEKQLSPPRCAVVHAWISRDIYEQLEHVAQLHRVHPDQLVAELVTRAYGPVEPVPIGTGP